MNVKHRKTNPFTVKYNIRLIFLSGFITDDISKWWQNHSSHSLSLCMSFFLIRSAAKVIQSASNVACCIFDVGKYRRSSISI